MIRTPRHVCLPISIGLVVAMVALPAVAQRPAAPPAAGAAPAENDLAVPALEANPAVRAALELPRETPADYFQAVTWLIDLGRPQLAKPIMEELAGLQLTDTQRAELVAQFGSRNMLRLARAAELAPQGAAFAEAAMAAAEAAAADPQRIAALVGQLIDPSPEVRQLARADLAATGKVGVNAALEVAARETDPRRRAALLQAVAAMEPLATGPLLAMLDTSDPALRAGVAALLEYLRVPQAVPFLQNRPGKAVSALSTSLARFEAGSPPFSADESNRIELWHWDDATKKLSSASYPAENARIIWMSRLAGELARLQPNDRQARRISLLLGLEASYHLPPQANDPLSEADLQLVSDVLADALEGGYAHAAIAVIHELARRNDFAVLYSNIPQPSPLADALGDPDRRVRFAALEAIMALDPPSPYPGCSRVPDALVWFASSSGDRQAVVAMPTLYAATDVAGMLAAHQLEAAATNRGREAVDMARRMADLEMIFVDMGILEPGVREVVYELRISPQTAAIPIALLADERRLADAHRLAGEHDRVLAASRLHSPEVLTRLAEDVAALAVREAVSPEERAAQAEAAAQWLDQLVRTRPFYTIRRSELQTAYAGVAEDGGVAADEALRAPSGRTELGVPSGRPQPPDAPLPAPPVVQ